MQGLTKSTWKLPILINAKLYSYNVKEQVRQYVLDMHVDDHNGFEHGSMVNIGQYSKYSSFKPQEYSSQLMFF